MIFNKINDFLAKSIGINRNLTNPTSFYSAKAGNACKLNSIENKISSSECTKDYSSFTDLSERYIEETATVAIDLQRNQKSPQFSIALSEDALYDTNFRCNFINRLRMLLEGYPKNPASDFIIKQDKPFLLDIFSFIESAMQQPKNNNKELMCKLEDEVANELLIQLQNSVNKLNNRKHDFLNKFEYVSKIIIEIIVANPSLAKKLQSKGLSKKIFSMLKGVSCDTDIWKLANIINREDYFFNENKEAPNTVFLFKIMKILSTDNQSLRLNINKIYKTTQEKMSFLMDKNIKLEAIKTTIGALRKKIDSNSKEIAFVLSEVSYVEKTIHEIAQRFEELEQSSTSLEKKAISPRIRSFLLCSTLKSHIEPTIAHSITNVHSKNVYLSKVISSNIEYSNKLQSTNDIDTHYSFEYPASGIHLDKETKARYNLMYNSILTCKKHFLFVVYKEFNISSIYQKKNISIEVDNIFKFFQQTVAEKKNSKTFLFVYAFKKAVYEAIKYIESNKCAVAQLETILVAEIIVNIKKIMCLLTGCSMNLSNLFETRLQDLLEVYDVYNHSFIELYSS